MARQVPAGEREIFPGVKLVRSTSGGYSVLEDGVYIGFIHASIGDQWNAYRRSPDTGGVYLGKFNQVESVRQILIASREAWRVPA